MVRFVETLWQDARYGARLLRRTPLFGFTATLSLAIGIGATTAIFSVGEALLFRPPTGVVEAERVVDIGRASDGFRVGTVSYANYLDIRQRAATLSGVYAYALFPAPMSLAGSEGAERIYGQAVTANFFTVLGARAAAGRLFGDEDNAPVVVLSHRFWRRRLNADPSLVGRVLHLNGRPLTAIGVAAEGFQGTTLRLPDVWFAIEARANAGFANRGSTSFLMGARLKPGVSRQQASAELDTISRALEREHPEENRGLRIRAAALSPSPDMRGPLAVFLALLIILVSIVLAVACTNVSGVLLARAATRRREIALRLAVGAARMRLVRQLLVEAMLLFALGGAAGVLLAQWITAIIVRFLPALPFPIGVALALDRRALLFAAGLSLLSALGAGLVPALRGAKVDLVSEMRDAASRKIGRMRLRGVFVVVQVALSMVLVVVAGLFVRALERAVTADSGLDARGVELADLDLSLAGYDETTGPVFARALVERLRALPGVKSATLAIVAPGSFEGLGFSIRPAGETPSAGPISFDAGGNIVEPGYFSTLGVALLSGRDFSVADRKGTQPVAIVSEATARRLWPDRDAVGQYLVRTIGPSPDATETLLVIGVARDVSYNSIVDGAREQFVYLPLQQAYMSRVTVVARAAGAGPLRRSIADLVRSMNASLPIVSAESLEDRIAVTRTPQRLAASLSGSLGLVGLLLSTIGIYGITAYAVAARTREIGVRLALGARPADVVRMVLGRGMSLVAIGGVIGLTIAAAASQVIAALLFGLPPLDLVSFGGTALLFTGAGLAACYVPVRRATNISVTEALRFE